MSLVFWVPGFYWIFPSQMPFILQGDSWNSMLEMCCFIIIHSEPLRNTASFLVITLSSPLRHLQVCSYWFSVFLTTSVDVWTPSLDLCVFSEMFSAWEGTDILEFLSVMPLLSALFYHLYSLTASQSHAQHQAVLSLGTLINKDFMFILEKFRTFTKSFGNSMIPSRGKEVQSSTL